MSETYFSQTPLSATYRMLAAAILAGVLCVFLLQAVSAAPAAASDTNPAIREILARGSAPDLDVRQLNLAALQFFYEHRAYQPGWTGSAAVESEARALITALEHADEDGLDPLDYHVRDAILRNAPKTQMDAAERDILLTDGALRYAREMRTGRPDIRALDSDVDLPDTTFDAPAALETALQSDTVDVLLSGLAPPDRNYGKLKQALARYREIAAKGGWPSLTVEKDPKSKGANVDPDILRQRLAFEDSQLSETQPDANDLVEAIKRFQLRHGLDVDGRLGQRTVDELNVPASERAMEIVANMERWRWLPRNLEDTRVTVNIPAAQLTVTVNGQTLMTSRVVVGRPLDRTPILRAVATSVTINPPWNVPSAIARREMLPKLHRHKSYLASENMILLDGPSGDPHGLSINWRGLGSFPYHVRQLPGPKNALGRIKLELPNRFDVYLHDTPAKSAFDLNARDLSHGCVRVQQILPLASYALSGDPGGMVSQLTDAIASGATQHLPMGKPLPIYMLYWTAFVDPDGSVEFRPDIYGRDQRLIAEIGGHIVGQRVTQLGSECRRT